MRYSPQKMQQQEQAVLQFLDKDSDLTDKELAEKVLGKLGSHISTKRVGNVRSMWQSQNRKSLRRGAASGHTAMSSDEAEEAQTPQELLGAMGVEARGEIADDAAQTLPPDVHDACVALGDAMEANQITQMLLKLEGGTVQVSFRRSIKGQAVVQRNPTPAE